MLIHIERIGIHVTDFSLRDHYLEYEVRVNGGSKRSVCLP